MSGISSLVDQLKAEDWLSPRLEETAVVEVEGWSRPKIYVRPSGTGGDCAREVQLGMLGHSTGFTETGRRRMDAGIDAHSRWEDRMANSGVLVRAEVPLIEFSDGSATTEDLRGGKLGAAVRARGRVTWRGKLDAIVSRNRGVTPVNVVEVKTVSSYGFDRLPRQTADRRKMVEVLRSRQPGHVRQLVQYIALLERHADVVVPGEDVSREGFILVEERSDPFRWRVFVLEVDDAAIEEAFSRPNEATEASLRGELLDPPYERSSQTCQRCFRKRVCFALQDGNSDEWKSVRTSLRQAASKSGP